MTRDLMYKDEVQQLVADAYEDLNEPDGPATGLYATEQLLRLPEPARRWALGVGNPVPSAQLRPGEDVVDLGCGAGVDALLAGMEVGPTGRVTGVDILASMTGRGAELADEAGLDNVSFVTCEMEDLPLPDDAADVAISNGSINLSARKSRVLAEAARVLRPGGRLAVSDLTIREEELPAEVITHPSAWAG
ncbi:MAG: methyltransferase domain-containing protein [Nitriliruptoraceae bacterium]